MRYKCVSIGVTALLAAIFAAASLASTAATPNQPSTWQVVGQVGGPTQAVAVQGDYAYVGVGLRLIVLDVSNPSTPTEVGSTTPFPYFVEDIAVSGTLAYVAAGGAGLRVVDITTPTAPIEVGFWDSPGYAEDVAVAGSTVYLADGPYGLRVVDVSDPAHLTPVGSAYDMNYAFEVAVSGNRAYIAAAGAGLLVADVSDPAHPAEVGALDTPGYAYSIAVSGTLAYIADGWEGVRIVNVSNPITPTVVSTYKTPGWAFDAVVSGTTAYVADAFGGLRVLNVSDLAHPVELGGYEMPGGHAGSVAVAGNMAYVADRNSGLRTVDVSDPTHPFQIGLYNPMGDAKEISVSGDYAFVGAGNFGLRVIDISQPTHPIQTGALEIGEHADYLELVPPYVYICAASGGSSLFVVDISNPAQPALLGQAQLFGACRGLDVKADVAYIANECGLELISVSDPLHPIRLGFLQMQDWMGSPDTTVGVAVTGTLAYVASSFAGLEVVDVSNPVSPTLVGAYDSGESFSQDVVLQGSRAYIADGRGLRIVDISDPYHPTGMGFYATPGEVYRVAIFGTMAYVADGSMGVSVVDVSNPYTPTLVGSFNTLGYAYEAAPSGGNIYVGDGVNGLLILKAQANGGLAQFYSEPVAAEPPGIAALSRQALLPRRAGLVPEGRSYDAMDPALADLSLSHPAEETGSGVNANEPRVTSACVVTTPADSGVGSLRDCLENATSGTQITFDPLVFSPTSPVTISLANGLPPLDDGYVSLDASNAWVVLDGSATPAGTPGLEICSDHNTIQGLQILHFSGSGINLLCGEYNLIGGNRFVGNGPLGQGNLLSANDPEGINIHGPDTMNNTVIGNLVGTDIHGTSALGNTGLGGIFLAGGCSKNTIGGLQPGERNIVSGNLTNGIAFSDKAHGNLVIGNYVGTDISGSFDLGNRGHGIGIEGGAYDNRVEGNLSSGNVRTGVCMSDAGSNYNVVVGNRIGTDASGAMAIANDEGGVSVGYGGASFNRIGGTGPGEGNLISGNRDFGIAVYGSGAVGNLILGNYVGTDIGGSRSLPNRSGVIVGGGAGHTIVGGAAAAERNLISGNGFAGISLGSDYNFVLGNYIGTDASGTAALGSAWIAVNADGAEHSVIQGNLIAYSQSHGFWVHNGSFNTIRRNSIHSNGERGIVLTDGGNQMLHAPVVLTVTRTTVSGTACPGCTVEVFSDDEDEGRIYEGSVVADGKGTFAFVKPTGLTGPHVTATATDSSGNTSEFSQFWPVRYWLYLPVVLRMP